jgi:hypothetical protein
MQVSESNTILIILRQPVAALPQIGIKQEQLIILRHTWESNTILIILRHPIDKANDFHIQMVDMMIQYGKNWQTHFDIKHINKI